jgi:hypothetical protein
LAFFFFADQLARQLYLSFYGDVNQAICSECLERDAGAVESTAQKWIAKKSEGWNA